MIVYWKSKLETGNPPLPKSGIIKRATAQLPQILVLKFLLPTDYPTITTLELAELAGANGH